MDLLPDEAQQEILSSTAAFLAGELPVARLRENGGPERIADPQWRRFAELGWFGLGLAEEQGGIGFTLAEEAILFRELGRALAPISLLATAIAARCSALAGDNARRDALIGGALRAGWAEPRGAVEIGARVRGSFRLIDSDGAELSIALGDAGAALLDLRALAPRAVASIDRSVPLADLEAEAPALCFIPASREDLPRRAAVLAAAMLAGLAEAARDDAARYAAERVQFGRPIGVFQAIKHRCADMAVRCEAAWTQTAYAALALRDGLAGAPFQVAAAKALAAQAALENAAANVQVHGGYGFTVEYDAQLFVKRAHVLDRIAGARAAQLAAVLAAPAPA